MSDENSESISLEEADIVLSSQVQMFKHIRNRLQRLLRLLLTFLGVSLTGLSLIVSFGSTMNISIDLRSRLVENSSFSNEIISAFLGLQFALIMVLGAVIIAGIFSAVLVTIRVLSGRGLKPGLGHDNEFTFLAPYKEPKETSEWTSDYQEWITYNAATLDHLRRRENECYKGLLGSALAASCLIILLFFILSGQLGDLIFAELFLVPFILVTPKLRRDYPERRLMAVFMGISVVWGLFLHLLLFEVLG